MRTGKRLWNAVAALAVAVPTAVTAFAAPAQAVGPDRLPFTFTNNTGRGDAVYLYVTGVLNGRLGYVNAGGTFTPWPAGAIPPSPAPDAAINGPGNGGSVTVQLPRGISGRLWMSLGEKLKFFLTPDGFVQPDVVNPSDPNRNILWDFSEFTYNNDGLWLNSTQVDMFAIPHAVTVTGSDGRTERRGDVVDNGRNKVIDAIRGMGSPWSNAIQTRSDGTVLRVLAPGKATAAGLMPGNYLDGYINNSWSTYTGKNLTVVPFGDQPNVKYYGRVSGNAMNFTDTSGQQVLTIQKPSTADVWNCNGALDAPNDQVRGPIARTICAALHRTTLAERDVQPSGGPADFYKNSTTNHYSRIIHANMADGRAYGFPFDDVLAQESLVKHNDPRSAGMILSPFGGGGSTPTKTRIISNWNNKCIDVPDWKFNDGQRLHVWDCTDGTNQKWEWINDTLRTENNMCMDVAWGSSENGAAIQIATCSGNPAQQFVLSGAADLVNPQANKCVDIKDWIPDNGAVLQLWECTGGAVQKWRKG